MRYRADIPPLVVILGETASGKSALAMYLANKFGGEIIAADSRTVYRGMDIGTAKPTSTERTLVRHHLIDVTSPDQPFTVADFKRQAQAAIVEVSSRKKLPILVGGTGLYIDALIYNFSFRPVGDKDQRKKLANLSVEQLVARHMERGISLPANDHNPRHLIRTLETGGMPTKRDEVRSNTLIIGLQISAVELRKAIKQRIDIMLERGLIEEVRGLGERYGWEVPALQAPAYKAFRRFLEGRISLEEAKEEFARYDLQLAKRQRTWFKRNKDVHWITNREEAVELLTTYLNK